MNYLQYFDTDVLNGEGVRATLFVSGCIHACPKCFNPKSQNFKSGIPFGREIQDRIISDLTDERINRSGLTLSGGDPFHPRNAEELIPFLKRVKKEAPEKNIWAWTGYKIEDLSGVQMDMLRFIDVLVDGKFDYKQADPSLSWRGSSNQKVHRLLTHNN